MADTTIPTPQDNTQAQDLQINLEANTAKEVIPQAKETSKIQEPELDLDLDLDLPDAPKDDDRLKTEDKKNKEETKEPVIESLVTEPVSVLAAETAIPPIAEPTIEKILSDIPAQKIIEPVITEPVNEPIVSEAEKINEPIAKEEIINPENQSSIMTQEVIVPSVATTELNDDMKMIEDLEGHASGGGLSPDAITSPLLTPAEETKTFDLEAMLGNPTKPIPPTKSISDIHNNTQQNSSENEKKIQEEIPTPIEQSIPAVIVTSIPATQTMITPPQISTPIPTPKPPEKKVFVPEKKNMLIKIVLFVLLFVALGSTTFFILKTMYPLEFDNILGGTQIQTTTGEDIPATETIATEIIDTNTGTTEEGIPGDTTGTEQLLDIISTGAHESATSDVIFGELGDLGVPTIEAPIQSDVSRLTDYITQGNKFLEEGKTMRNNTIIKYGLYISKKATTFLEQIANGEQINNLSGYFAQFDKYLVQLKELTGQSPDTTVQTGISDTVPANDTTPSQDTPVTAE